MSFNVRYGTAPDGKNGWSYRRPLVSQLILDNTPHVLGIQEGLRFQLDDLSADLAIYAEVGCGRDDGKNAGEHSSIFYKKDIFNVLDTGTFWFSETPDLPGSCDWGNRVPRICTWVVLQEKKKQYGFYLYNLHLDHRSSKSRRKSVLLLIDRIIKRDHKFPVIITGDFNVGERNAVIKYLSGKVTHGVHNEKCPIDLVDVHRVVNQKLFCGTYNHFRGYRFGPRIDFIFAETAIEVHSSKIIRTEFNGRYASDHFPVQAVLQLP